MPSTHSTRLAGEGIVLQTKAKTMSIEPKVYPDPKLDRQAILVRGVCGALLGVVLAIVIWMRNGGFGPVGSAALFGLSIAGCIFGSIRHGDTFWYRLLRR
jgi:hypothetical protein